MDERVPNTTLDKYSMDILTDSVTRAGFNHCGIVDGPGVNDHFPLNFVVVEEVVKHLVAATCEDHAG